MLVTKDLDKKSFDYIYPWGKNLKYIEWDVWAFYHRNVGNTPFQYLFDRDMIFNLKLVVEW